MTSWVAPLCSPGVTPAAPFDVLEITVDQPILILRRDLLLNPIAGELHREVGGVLDQLALGQPHLQFDLAPGLLEQPFAFGGGQRRDALLLGGDFFGPAFPQRVDLAGQRLQLAVDLRQLRCRGRFDVRRFDEILANRAVPIAQVGDERLLQEPPEPPTRMTKLTVGQSSAADMPSCSPSAACSPCSAATPGVA